MSSPRYLSNSCSCQQLPSALALYNATQDENKAYTSRSCPVVIEPQAAHDVLARQKARLRKVLDSGYDMWTEKEKYKSLYLQQQIELHAHEARDEEARRVIVALEGEKTVLLATLDTRDETIELLRGNVELLKKNLGLFEEKALLEQKREKELVMVLLRALLRKTA